MSQHIPLIEADWPAPDHVLAFTTTRHGGVSRSPYDALNVGDHVDDVPAHVTQNRQRLADATGLPASSFAWLQQVHGVDVPDAEQVLAARQQGQVCQADGSYSSRPGQACVVMTADCLPVLICDRAGTQVAAVHAGWRGLLNGVIETAVKQFAEPDAVMAWLGPAIGPQAFEVGDEVRAAFVAQHSEAKDAFVAQPSTGKYLANLYWLARQRLAGLGVTSVYGGDRCTYLDTDSQGPLFYSYRRDGAHTGRMASVIALKA